MFSVRCNSRVKLRRNKKWFIKGNKNFQSEKLEKNNVTIALGVLYAKKEKIYSAYVSIHSPNRENQVIL